MTSAQQSSLPAGASPTSVQSAPAQVTAPNGERIPLQIEGMDAAQVTSLMKLFQKVCMQ